MTSFLFHFYKNNGVFCFRILVPQIWTSLHPSERLQEVGWIHSHKRNSQVSKKKCRNRMDIPTVSFARRYSCGPHGIFLDEASGRKVALFLVWFLSQCSLDFYLCSTRSPWWPASPRKTWRNPTWGVGARRSWTSAFVGWKKRRVKNMI